jgi:hypothetical protein
VKAVNSAGQVNCHILLDTKKEINDYYLVKEHLTDLPVTLFDEKWGKGIFPLILDSCKTEQLAYGCLTSANRECYPQALEKYPFLLRHESYPGGDFYLFSKDRTSPPLNEYFSDALNTFEPNSPDWSSVEEKFCTDSLPISGRRSFLNSEGSEYGTAYIKSLRDMYRSENDVIDVSVDLRIPQVFPGAWLVIAITSDGKMIKWASSPVGDFIKPGQTGRVYQSLRLSDVELRHHRLLFTTYLWNPMHSTYVMDNFRVRMRSGNPVIYGLYRKNR